MAIQTYAYNSSATLSAHFCAQEFRCKCGNTHQILISEELIHKLEQLYTALNCSKIIINSGYRCSSHDKAVGGTGTGQHTKGTAADVVCYNQAGGIISSKTVCCTAQDVGFTGIANITSAYTSTHLDVRSGSKWYGDETKGNNTVTNNFYSYFGIPDTVTKTGTRPGVKASGIDVSKHQGTIDWDKVKTSGKVDFAMLRAGYGKETSQIDPQFERNYRACKRLGIPCGAYWYSYAASVAEAKQEAVVCLSALAGKQFAYPIAYDIEESNSLKIADAITEAFCDSLEDAGYYVMLYSYKSALESNFSNATKAKYDTWLAHVDVERSSYTGSYGLWQYSWKGSVPGISGDVDLDNAYKDYPTMIQNAGLNGTTPAASGEGNSAQVNSGQDDADTLEQILTHVANIDEKLK